MNRPIVLTYHSLDESGSWTSISPELFKKQMAYLIRNDYHCISLRGWIETVISRRQCPPRTFVLTFDDGYKDNYEIALPILKAHKFTATVFVVTGQIGMSAVWEKKEGIPDLPMMSVEDIREMSKSGIDIQPHSHNHPSLPKLEEAGIKEEILCSKGTIEAITKKEADLFCYPYGHYDNRVISLLKNQGFKGAVTIDFGRDDAGADPFRLKRIGSARFRTLFRFGLVMTGWYEKIMKVKRILK